jgi:hypothetical protein
MNAYKIYCRQKGVKKLPGKNKKRPLSEEEKKRLKSLGYL